MPGNIKYAFSSVSADSDIIRVPCDCARVPKSSCLAATRHRLMLTLVRRSRGTLPQYYVRVRAKNNGLPKARKGKDPRCIHHLSSSGKADSYSRSRKNNHRMIISVVMLTGLKVVFTDLDVGIRVDLTSS